MRRKNSEKRNCETKRGMTKKRVWERQTERWGRSWAHWKKKLWWSTAMTTAKTSLRVQTTACGLYVKHNKKPEGEFGSSEESKSEKTMRVTWKSTRRRSWQVEHSPLSPECVKLFTKRAMLIDDISSAWLVWKNYYFIWRSQGTSGITQHRIVCSSWNTGEIMRNLFSLYALPLTAGSLTLTHSAWNRFFSSICMHA